MQNQPLADAESAQASSALTDQMIVSRQTQPNLLVIILGTCIITAVVFGCSGYYFGRQSPSALDTQAQVSPLPLNTAAQTEAGTLALQKSYTNKKHGYTIQYPDNYIIGYQDYRAGKVYDATGEEDTLDVLAPNEDEAYNHYIEIQVTDANVVNKNLYALAQDTYTEQKDSSASTTEMSTLNFFKFNNVDAYGYTFVGDGIDTLAWSAMVPEGKYRVIFFQKNNKIYSMYLRDTAVFNQIVSSFSFN